MTACRLFAAIPAMDELACLPLLLHDLAHQQTSSPYEVFVCINQPEIYWNISDKKTVALHNRQLLSMLQDYREMPVHIINRSSRGKGWTGKNYGVGMARKVLFDTILQIAEDEDVIVSLDADTRISTAYLQSIADHFAAYPELPVLAVPYYHPLTGDDICDRAILRYELYMRNYWLNMQRIGSPYHFTALGSAMAFKAGALRKIGGITPIKSGEDFYLMQKFRKTVAIGQYNVEAVYPAARYSARVPFGTGPALINGSRGQWDAYPIYHHALFEDIAATYKALPRLYETDDVHTAFLDFLQSQSRQNRSIWLSIRQNIKDLPHFIQAFHEKADGLRILQYLRQKQSCLAITDEQSLRENIRFLFSPAETMPLDDAFSFAQYPIDRLNILRNLFYDREMNLRKAEDSVIHAGSATTT